MKKLILGIIAVFLFEIGFITYLQLNSTEGPTTASVDNKIAAPIAELSRVEGTNNDPPTPEPGIQPDSSHSYFRRPKLKAVRTASVRVTARRFQPRAHQIRSLSARAVPKKPRMRVSPRPGYHFVVEREYFGRMVVEVSYRVYNFRPRGTSKSKKGQIIA